MIGYRPGPWMKYSWAVITPALCVGCFVFSLVKYVPLTYNKVYRYPDWAIGLGWGLALSSMLCIPLVIVILLCRTEGPLRVVSTGHGPCEMEDRQCRFLCEVRQDSRPL